MLMDEIRDGGVRVDRVAEEIVIGVVCGDMRLEMISNVMRMNLVITFFFQAEDGIRDPLWSRRLGDVYMRQALESTLAKNLCQQSSTEF